MPCTWTLTHGLPQSSLRLDSRTPLQLDSRTDSPPLFAVRPAGVAPTEEAKLAPCIVVVVAVGAVPVVLLEDLRWAVTECASLPEVEIAVPACPTDPIAFPPWSLKWTPFLAVPVGAIELPLGNQLLARLTCPRTLRGHIRVVGPRT